MSRHEWKPAMKYDDYDDYEDGYEDGRKDLKKEIDEFLHPEKSWSSILPNWMIDVLRIAIAVPVLFALGYYVLIPLIGLLFQEGYYVWMVITCLIFLIYLGLCVAIIVYGYQTIKRFVKWWIAFITGIPYFVSEVWKMIFKKK